MGIVNVTPDSFSDGGQYLNPDSAVEHAKQLVLDGADILDIGGESTRPGSVTPDTAEELRRVIPVIKLLTASTDVPISVDTSNPDVMRAAIQAGASMINDVRALQNEGAIQVAAEFNVPVCLMHMQGDPQTMQKKPHYINVVEEVIDFLRQRISVCENAGIKKNNIIVDPGFGFGKSLAHNLTLLQQLSRIDELGHLVLAGLSRKSMIVKLLGYEPENRITSSVIFALKAFDNGAKILRVHDVKTTQEALRVWNAVNKL